MRENYNSGDDILDVDVSKGLNLDIIEGDSESSRFVLGVSIKTANSIAIWYALKTTIDYLTNRDLLTEQGKMELDGAAKKNLKSISSYLKKSLNILNVEGEINTNLNNNNNNNLLEENIKPNQQVNNINSVVVDIDNLVGILDGAGNNPNLIVENNQESNDESVGKVLKKYLNQSKSIEDIVFNELVEMEIGEHNNIDDKKIDDKKIDDKEDVENKTLRVKYDFDELKREIKSEASTSKSEKKNAENELFIKDGDEEDKLIQNENEGNYETRASMRNKKVFLSRAAKEFKDKVSKLKDVEDSKTRDRLIDDYNEAVEKLDNAIMEAVKEKIKNNRDTMAGGYHEGQLSNILTALGLNSINGNDIKSNKKGKKKKKLEDNNGLDGEIQQIMTGVKGDCITGDNEKKLLNTLSKHLKKKLVMARSNGERQKCVKEFCPEDEKMSTSVSKALEVFIEKFSNLTDVDRKEISTSGEKIKQKENKGNKKNVNDLKAIANANSEELEKITLEYGEYNEFVATELFSNGDNLNIEETMNDFFNRLLLTSNSDEFQKAKGQMDGIAAKVHKEVKILKEQDLDDKLKGKYLQRVLSLSLSSQDIKNKGEKFFVPTFIEGLFKLDSEDKLDDLAKNLGTLGKDKDFQMLLSDIMEDDFAVKMIKDNFERTKEQFESADYTATRRYRFKREFWDNNLKGHLTEWSGRIKRNSVMLGFESLGGFAGGTILASEIITALSLTGETLPFIVTCSAIVVTVIAIAVIISLVMTVFKGLMDLTKGDGFYCATSREKQKAEQLKKEYVQKIYNAFLIFGADEKKLRQLMRRNQNSQLDKNSSEGKFFKSMIEMKNFLKTNAKAKSNAAIEKKLKDSMPFKMLEQDEINGIENNMENIIK